jgi:hypothetical protein
MRQTSCQRAKCATVGALHLHFHFGRATDVSKRGFRKLAYSSAETEQLNKLRTPYFKPSCTELTILGSYFQTIRPPV